MMATKKFHLSDILSVTTGRLVSTRHMDGIYDILNFMTGDNLFTHQLPRASKECEPYLLKQFPELAKAGTPQNLARLDELLSDAKHRNEPLEKAIEMWLKWMVEPGTCNLKMEYEVEQIPSAAHQHKDPIAEMHEMAPNAKVIVAEV